jgi:hypothetical protein
MRPDDWEGLGWFLRQIAEFPRDPALLGGLLACRLDREPMVSMACFLFEVVVLKCWQYEPASRRIACDGLSSSSDGIVSTVRADARLSKGGLLTHSVGLAWRPGQR